MATAPNLCGVILAAGRSSRMGSDKALLSWPPANTGSGLSGQTFLSAAIQSFDPYSEMVIVVAGLNAANLAPVAYAHGAVLVTNPAPERGQFSSLQVGLQEVLNRGRDAAILTLVDRPPVQPSTIESLYHQFATRPHEIWAVIPEYRGGHGHPVLLGREMMEAFLKARPTANARELEHLNEQHIKYIALEDPMVILNVDTPEDYAALASSFYPR
ncbi:MAG TPA: nucleotidyltransferase family protein [Terriglobales bacterium]|nr:nucleotidyltransferase family protein [Terriglobales bacterium]